jgi:hypothetical protein
MTLISMSEAKSCCRCGRRAAQGRSWGAAQDPANIDLMTESIVPGDIVMLKPWSYSDLVWPVFFEPLDLQKIESAGLGYIRVVIVLDGEKPHGQQYVAGWRKQCYMSPRNIAIFGDSPYYYAMLEHNQIDNEMVYLVYMQGDPSPEARPKLARAMLRQWCADDAPSQILSRIRSAYLEDDKEFQAAGFLDTPQLPD